MSYRDRHPAQGDSSSSSRYSLRSYLNEHDFPAWQITRDAITWRSYRALRLPFGIVVVLGREWR